MPTAYQHQARQDFPQYRANAPELMPYQVPAGYVRNDRSVEQAFDDENFSDPAPMYGRQAISNVGNQKKKNIIDRVGLATYERWYQEVKIGILFSKTTHDIPEDIYNEIVDIIIMKI